MKTATTCLLALLLLAVLTGPLYAPAGRFLPPIRPFRPPVGPHFGPHFIPHHGHSRDDSDTAWIWILGGMGVIWLIAAIVKNARSTPTPSQKPYAARPDYIHRPEEAAARERTTEEQLRELARHDPRAEPVALREWVSWVFYQVQKAWEAGDYTPVRSLLGPELCARHEQLLATMRSLNEVNRQEGTKIERLELLQARPGPDGRLEEFAALLTFRMRSYFADAHTGAYHRGDQGPVLYQELWIFQRQGEGWQLNSIERTRQPTPARPEETAV